MRFQSTIIAFVASLAFTNAQDLSGVPTCAIPCLVAALPASGCGATDVTCQCTTGRDAITSSLTSCAPQKCSSEDAAALAPALAKVCAAAGITVSDLPTAASSAVSAAASSAASAATSVLSGSRTASMSDTPTSASFAQQSTAAAAAHVVGLGSVAMGFAVVFL